MNKLLSFINMDDDIIKQFINEISRDLLLVPVVNDKKYSKRPGIKGFRREKISKNILDSLYFSEIKKNKSSSKLGNFIIEAIDKNMKDCLADDSYKVLQEEDFEKVITVLEEYFNSSKRMFKKKYVRGLMNLPDDISAKFDAEDLKEKLDVLDTVNKLSLKNEFICTQTLKEIYECTPKPSYRLISKGVYNLSKNLNVSNNQEIFSLRED